MHELLVGCPYPVVVSAITCVSDFEADRQARLVVQRGSLHSLAV